MRERLQNIYVILALLVGICCFCITLLEIRRIKDPNYIQRPVSRLARKLHQNFSSERISSEVQKGSVSSPEIRKTPKNIYFIELINRTQWHPITVCSVFTAAVKNPDSKITLFSKQMNLAPKWRNLTNLHLTYLDEHQILNGTPLLDWYLHAVLKKSQFHVHEVSDALRIALLFQFGGMYLDSDTFVIRPLPAKWKNAIAQQRKGVVTNGFLAFEKDHLCLQSNTFFFDHNAVARRGDRGARGG